MHVKIKNKPKLTLSTMLKRRRRPLKTFLSETGINSYSALVKYCDANGIDPISEIEYKKHAQIVTDPSEGIIVLDIVVSSDAPETVLDDKQKKRRKKHADNI